MTAVLDASRKKDYEDKKFAASLQGIDLEDEKEVEDISALKFSNVASKEGFGINEGLGFMVQE